MSIDKKFKKVFENTDVDGKVSISVLTPLFNKELTKDNPVAYLVNNNTIIYPSEDKTPLKVAVPPDIYYNSNAIIRMVMGVRYYIDLRKPHSGCDKFTKVVEIQEVAGKGLNVKPIKHQSEVEAMINTSLDARNMKTILENESVIHNLVHCALIEREDYVYTDTTSLDDTLDYKGVFRRYTGKRPTEFFDLRTTHINYEVQEDV